VDLHVKLTDFGLSIRIEEAREAKPAGTLAYMGPEVFDGRGAVTEKLDVFAFGQIVLEVFARTPPACPEGGSPALPAPEALSRVRAPRLRALVARCLEVSPDLRPSAREIVKETWNGAIFFPDPRLTL
jgi:serine/threonine protein kinase